MRPVNYVIILLMVLPSCAFALDMSYYTYGGFEQTVDAFNKIALIFHDAQYKTLIGVFAVLGVLLGGITLCGKMTSNTFNGNAGGVPLSLVALPLLGCIIFKAMVLPSGTMYIYDRSTNQSQAIGHIPDLILLAAGTLNKIERGFIEIINTNSAIPYEANADALSFKLFYDTVIQTSNFSNIPKTLVQSIERYNKDCVPLAFKVSSDSINLSELNSGSEGLKELLGHARNGASYTVYYNDANPNGMTLSCRDAWSNDYILGDLADSRVYENLYNQICSANGFIKNEIGSNAECKKSIDGAVKMILHNDTLDSKKILTNNIIAAVLAQAQLDNNPDLPQKLLTNRAMIMDGIAKSMGTDQWFPLTKATATAVILGLFPLLMLFMVTPLFPKVLNLTFCLFAWLALWGICDAMMHESTVSTMLRAFAEVRSNGLGLKSVWLVPTASMKALALYASNRSTTVSIATFIASVLFGLSSYALTSFARGMNQSDDESVQASKTVNSPQRSAEVVDGLTRSNATFDEMRRVGFGGASAAASFKRMEGTSSALAETARLGGHSGDAGMRAGMIHGAGAAGRIVGIEQQTAEGTSPMDTAYNMQSTQASSEVAQAQGKEIAATELGYNSAADAAEVSAHADTLQAGVQSQAFMAVKDKQGFDKIMKSAGFETASRITSHATTAEMLSNDPIEAGTHVGVQQGAAVAAQTKSTENMAADLNIAGGGAGLQSKMSEVETKERVGRAMETQGQMDQIQEHRPDLNDGEIAKEHGAFAGSSQRADIGATKGRPDDLISYKQQETRMNMDQQHAYLKELEKQGLNPAQAKAAAGAMQAVHDGANVKTLERVDTGSLVRAAVLDSKFHVGKANHMAELANKVGGVDNLVKMINASETGREFANAVIMSDFADRTEQSVADVAIAERGAHMSVAITPEQVEQYKQQGIINQAQADAIEKNGGGVYNFTYNPTDGMQKPVLTSTLLTGNKTVEDNSELHDSSYRDEIGVTTGNDSLNLMSMDISHRNALANTLHRIDGNQAQEIKFIRGLAENISSIQNRQTTSSTSLSEHVSASAAVEGKVSKGVKVAGIKGKVSASAKAEVGVSANHSDGISSSSDRNFQTIHDMYQNSESRALDKINRYLDENHPDLSESERESYAERMKYTKWAKELQEGINSYYAKELSMGIKDDKRAT